MNHFEHLILGPFSQSCQNEGDTDKNAFFICGAYYTYRQLAKRISAIRSYIHTWRSAEKVVALAIHDDLDTYASIFALWMEGKAYVPLHPAQPLERSLNIVNQVGCGYILDSSQKSFFSVADASYEVCCTSSMDYSIDFLDNWADIQDNELAYVLFTSGSTGVPKGVPLSRKNLASFVRSFWTLGYEISDRDRFLQCFDLTFDLSIISYLIPLLRGACVYTVPYEVTKFIYIISLFQDQDISFALMTPSTLLYMRPYFAELSFPSLRYSLFCGEALSTDTALAWKKCLPNGVVDNVYGPTEDTIFCSRYRLRENDNVEHNGVLSIGTPMSGNGFLVIDESGNEVASGEIGELCLSGEQLTEGYWNNPSKNKESFWTDSEGRRYYKSGDMCFSNEDGDFLYVGRKDSQVKVNGFRIELSEIEYYARAYLDNQCNVLAMAFSGETGQSEIALFVESESVDSSGLQSFLQEKLPAYMIPSRYIFEAQFPHNNSNKIDRTKLKQSL